MSMRYQPSSRQSSGWLVLTPWTRLIGTDWLVRLVRPRVIRSPRGDSASVKLNMPITRRQINDNMPMSNGIKPPNARGTTPSDAVTTTMMIEIAAGTSHSVDSRKLMINRCGVTWTSG